LVTLIIDDEMITCRAEAKKGAISDMVSFDKPISIGKQIEFQIRPHFLMDVLEKATFMYVTDNSVLFKRQAFQHLAFVNIS
jgi:hypothetical protein